MKQVAKYVALAGTAALALALFVDGSAYRTSRVSVAQTGDKQQPDDKAKAEEPADPAKKAVLANVRTFTEAFNRQDVKTILKLFADDCVLTESDGTTVRGLKELEAELKETFKNEPDAKIGVNIDSLQVVAPDVMVEEGKTTYFPDGKTLTAETPYQATHVKRGDRWVMTKVRSFDRVVLHPYDQLRELEWLIGDWIDESPDSLVESSYRWDADKMFLLNDFKVRVQNQKVYSGTQRIGRDPLSKQIKAWVFDSDGGYAESLWSEVEDDTWLIQVKGVRADGKVVTMTNQLTKLPNDRYRFESANRKVGNERMADFAAIAVRRPPEAKR
jgi:uncharacterized protein (TIGR02246 family)